MLSGSCYIFPMKNKNILLIEDDLLSRIALEQKLKSIGQVSTACSSEEARAKIKSNRFDMAFVDLDLDRKLEGLKLIPLLKEKNIYTVVLSAREEFEVVTNAYNLGCSDYLVKPFSNESLKLVFKKLDQKNLKHSLNKTIVERFHYQSEELDSLISEISSSLLSNNPILITGESGTGKTYLAKLIHELSGDHLPFVAVNCSEFSESLLESELFGHAKGSFTGAIKDKKGLLEMANNGILFLDEVSTMSLTLQKKLLKAIEEKEFYPVGSENKVTSQFRLISATCENLADQVIKGTFREDLFFRIEGFNLKLKSLKENKLQIKSLVEYFIKKNPRRIVIEEEAMDALLNYSWPGNIRELEKTIDVLCTLEKGIITKADIKLKKLIEKSENHDFKFDFEAIKKVGLNAFVEKMEMDIVDTVYKDNDEKVRKTLNDLKISNNSFYRIMDSIKNNRASL